MASRAPCRPFMPFLDLFRPAAAAALLALAAASCDRGVGTAAPHPAVMDDSGAEVRIPADPARVVSLLPSITASIIELGAAGRIAGATRWCRLPEGSGDVAIVGDMLRPDIEKIISLRPDVVFASMEGSSRAHVMKMRGQGAAVYVFGECRSFAGMKEQFERLGMLLGLGEAARDAAGRAERDVEEVTGRIAGAARPKVLLALGDGPLVSCAEGSFNHEMIGLAGGSNVAAGFKTRYPEVPVEKVLIDDPDVIVVADMAGLGQEAAGKWKAFPGLSAVKAGRVHVVDGDSICQPTPFAYARGLRTLARLFHPELFG